MLIGFMVLSIVVGLMMFATAVLMQRDTRNIYGCVIVSQQRIRNERIMVGLAAFFMFFLAPLLFVLHILF